MDTAWWVLIGLMVFASIVLRHNLLFLISLLLALVGGTAEVWNRYCLAGVSYRRRFGSTRLFYGEETDLYVEIVNAKPLPMTWLCIEDEFPADIAMLTGSVQYSFRPRRRLLVNRLSLRWYERVTRRYRLRGSQRGAWKFGPVMFEAGDLFGFASRREELHDTQTILVYPRVVPITALGLPACRPFGDFGAARRVMEDPLRLMGAREYRPGDSFRHIHWKATARHRQLQTRVFEPSASRSLAVFLNVNTFEYLYEGLDTVLQELAITAAASIARYAWEDGYQPGLYVNSIAQPEGQRIRIQPGNRPDHLTRIWEALARVVIPGPWPIEGVLQLEAGRLRYGTTLVVVTPVINERLCQTLLELQRKDFGVVLVTLGQARLDASLPGIQYYHLGGREVWDELESLALAG